MTQFIFFILILSKKMNAVYSAGLIFFVYKTFTSECFSCTLFWGILLINTLYAILKNLGYFYNKKIQIYKDYSLKRTLKVNMYL
jgi:hypothetical protein